MIQVCRQCKTELNSSHKSECLVTEGICPQCTDSISRLQGGSLNSFLDSIDAPVLLMQPEPRQVLTANKKACALFNKTLSQIAGSRGGQVFDCIHAFSEAGCGKDINCEDCSIKNAVVGTFQQGQSYNGVSTVLEIKKNGALIKYRVQVTTEKTGDLALVRIDRYETSGY